MPIFKKKSSRGFLEKTHKLFIVVTLLQWKFWNFFSRNLRKDFLLKIGILSAKVYTKKVPNIVVDMWLHLCPTLNCVYEASHCSTLQIGCVNLFGRLYLLLSESEDESELDELEESELEEDEELLELE